MRVLLAFTAGDTLCSTLALTLLSVGIGLGLVDAFGCLAVPTRLDMRCTQSS